MEMTLLFRSTGRLNIFPCFQGERGGNSGTYAGLALELSTLFVNFKPGMVGLDCFCTFIAGFPGEDPRNFANETGNDVPFPSAKGLVMLVNAFSQNGDRQDGKRLHFTCILFLSASYPSLT